MDSTPSSSSRGRGLRRFSFGSSRSSSAGHNSNSHHPIPTPEPTTAPPQNAFAHRQLYFQTRGSRPPTSGPNSRSQTPVDMTNSRAGHQPQRSMPSDLSSLLGNVKRQLSFNSRKASGLQDGPTSAGYYGMTAEEDAARVYNLPPPPSLVPPPTFQQIASGVAVRSRRTPGTRRPSTTDSTVSPPPAPPVKRASSFSRLFSTSQPSLPPPPLPTNIVYPHNAASSSSSTTASTSTSSSSAPAVKHHAKHKLSLSISTITGRAPRGRGIQAIGSGANSSMSSMDSGVSWGGLDDGRTSAKKAVRFSEDGSDPTVSPGIKTPNHRSPSPAPARRVLPSTALLLPPTTTRQPFPQPTSSTTFVEKTTRLFSR